MQYHTDLTFESNAEDITIIDECDAFIMESPDEFFQFSKNNKIIGFSGSCDEDDLSNLEKELINIMGIYRIDYWPQTQRKPAKATITKHIPMESLKSFIVEERKRCPLLIYCEQAEVEWLGEW